MTGSRPLIYSVRPSTLQERQQNEDFRWAVRDNQKKQTVALATKRKAAKAMAEWLEQLRKTPDLLKGVLLVLPEPNPASTAGACTTGSKRSVASAEPVEEPAKGSSSGSGARPKAVTTKSAIVTANS